MNDKGLNFAMARSRCHTVDDVLDYMRDAAQRGRCLWPADPGVIAHIPEMLRRGLIRPTNPKSLAGGGYVLTPKGAVT